MPKSLFLSVRRKCSNFEDYLHYATLLCFNLNSRGYDFNSMYKILKIVGNIERETLLPYRKKPDFMSKLDIIWPIYYDSAFVNLNSLIQTFWFENFWHTNFYILNLILVSKVLTNLRSFLLFIREHF